MRSASNHKTALAGSRTNCLMKDPDGRLDIAIDRIVFASNMQSAAVLAGSSFSKTQVPPPSP